MHYRGKIRGWSKMTVQFQSSTTEWIRLPLSKMENLKVGNKFVRYLGINDEFHLGHDVFETLMGNPWENVLDKWKYGLGIQDRFRVRVMRVENRLKTQG